MRRYYNVCLIDWLYYMKEKKYVYNYFLPFFLLLASRLGADTLTLLIIVLIASMSGTLLMSSFSRAVASDEFKNTDCACFRAIELNNE